MSASLTSSPVAYQPTMSKVGNTCLSVTACLTLLSICKVCHQQHSTAVLTLLSFLSEQGHVQHDALRCVLVCKLERVANVNNPASLMPKQASQHSRSRASIFSVGFCSSMVITDVQKDKLQHTHTHTHTCTERRAQVPPELQYRSCLLDGDERRARKSFACR